MGEGGSAYRLAPHHLVLDPEAFIAEGAVVVGDVHVAAGASVWFGAILRGDVESIRIGPDANVQDGTVVHADPGFPVVLGRGVTVGHRCIVHGCRVGAGTMVGMGSILMNGVVVGEECLIGAGTLITQGKQIPPRSLVLGSPGVVRRPLTEGELASIRSSTRHYVALAAGYRDHGFDRRPQVP